MTEASCSSEVHTMSSISPRSLYSSTLFICRGAGSVVYICRFLVPGCARDPCEIGADPCLVYTVNVIQNTRSGP